MLHIFEIAKKNIIREGIHELESESKTKAQ